jgi:RNA polymerase sigma-70 factor (ECF subfamily)
MSGQDAGAAFDRERPMLRRVAYRMLGSVADAEDVVQETWLRWAAADQSGVDNPAGFLRRIVTRLCLDQLKSARSRREEYWGPWLPDPVVEPEETDDVTLPLMLALERLSPLERAAFLLHDVFGQSFDEVAATIGRDPAACRQLAARARDHVRAERPRYPVERDEGAAIAEAFFAASRSGDMARLGDLLAEGVVLYSDGGGKRSAAGRPMIGRAEVLRAQKAIARLHVDKPTLSARFTWINGLPGFVSIEHDGLPQTTALAIEDGRIVAIYVVRNPDKLGHLSTALH